MFQCRPAGEVSGPKIVSVICIREEIISLQSPVQKEKSLPQYLITKLLLECDSDITR